MYLTEILFFFIFGVGFVNIYDLIFDLLGTGILHMIICHRSDENCC